MGRIAVRESSADMQGARFGPWVNRRKFDMKKTQAVPRKANALNVPPSPVSLDEEEDNQQEESRNFSAERITARAAITTNVLKDILAREDSAPELRYWGINE